MTEAPGTLAAAHRIITDLRVRLSRATALAAWRPERTDRYLFIGGPRHGETLCATGPVWRIAVPRSHDVVSWDGADAPGIDSEYDIHEYERRRIGASSTEQARTVYTLRGLSDEDARNLLRDYVLIAWIAAMPDAEHSCTTPGCPDS